ncbi:isoamyl acetate-hydrolyzing esterase 1 homolog [Mizuhopecten yessoensis]|uniref:Isoamyl acetate-hydrolyzing esterase 1-like n=1 Tax=Mizuhopecten yessoensis TaxID=6573 RepID=A0A210QWZ0_MIZYE|nr:isoamyl acetate-hydrolyzing esterase 1 homolog [Mizuhopecten yessoensis]OWF53234.1 Isoamyl acetate-hydrolyzing esterase 1-like [Mizuhopecten yessoensis]
MASRGKETFSQSTQWPKVVLFGDSITQLSFSNDGCWGSMLADLLQRKCDVINRGYSGYNARWCVKMISKVFEEFASRDVAMVTIFLGANDSNLPANSHQHVPAEEYKTHLINMVEKLQMLGIPREKIILVTPPACDVIAWEADCVVNGRQCQKCNKAAGQYANLCKEASIEAGTGCIDLYTEMMKVKDWEKLLKDGLHLSTKGSALLFQLLKPFVLKVTSGI